MQMKCSWILPSFATRVEYARVRDINFKSAKKMKVDLDKSIENVAGNRPDFGDISHLGEITPKDTKRTRANRRGNGNIYFRTQQGKNKTSGA